MGTIQNGGFYSDYTGAEMDAIWGKADDYPAESTAEDGDVPVYRDNAIDWEPQSGSGGGVTSFNSRTGAVVPVGTDYPPALTGSQPQVTYVAVTLLAANWSSNEQTVTVTGVSATETDQLIQPVPASASRSAYESAQVKATAQAANSLTFACATTPSSDLTVYVCITELEAAT